jgi:hypothetical protein
MFWLWEAPGSMQPDAVPISCQPKPKRAKTKYKAKTNSIPCTPIISCIRPTNIVRPHWGHASARELICLPQSSQCCIAMVPVSFLSETQPQEA